MHANAKDLYSNLFEYIHELVGDRVPALRLVNTLVKADVPLQTFVTAVKLYKMILNRINRVEMWGADSCGVNFRILKRRPFLDSNNFEILRNQYLIFLSCCVIASKYYRDVAFTNESWELVSETDKRSLNEAERVCLMALDYQVSEQGDGSVLESILKILNNSGILLNERNTGPIKRIKVLVRKVLCFS
ncbi:uncharacterized protein VICG_01191 [Vittaforma corneae ATCC 50505]|uniref:Cyclin N-terminal domain-containing protein n=1 Tax=Vittaforma corneae (strain ATCC 50505) TaxID=993615 RepID=L2GMH1_VITCO|nr:uncharacterized protein VICG_01191 [Vittaforma corneae ATCC 50505]ELA41839.1 hypothetical protein VICG_01191 [Vittaforma corneae ATCC 50505]